MQIFAPLIAAALAFAIAVGPVAAGVTKAVDFVRNAIDAVTPEHPAPTKPKWLWQVLAGVFGVGTALLFQLNFIGPIVSAIPALANQSPHLLGVWGQVLTGFGIMGFSGYWHEKMAMWSANSKLAVIEMGSGTIGNV